MGILTKAEQEQARRDAIQRSHYRKAYREYGRASRDSKRTPEQKAAAALQQAKLFEEASDAGIQVAGIHSADQGREQAKGNLQGRQDIGRLKLDAAREVAAEEAYQRQQKWAGRGVQSPPITGRLATEQRPMPAGTQQTPPAAATVNWGEGTGWNPANPATANQTVASPVTPTVPSGTTAAPTGTQPTAQPTPSRLAGGRIPSPLVTQVPVGATLVQNEDASNPVQTTIAGQYGAGYALRPGTPQQVGKDGFGNVINPAGPTGALASIPEASRGALSRGMRLAFESNQARKSDPIAATVEDYSAGKGFSMLKDYATKKPIDMMDAEALAARRLELQERLNAPKPVEMTPEELQEQVTEKNRASLARIERDASERARLDNTDPNKLMEREAARIESEGLLAGRPEKEDTRTVEQVLAEEAERKKKPGRLSAAAKKKNSGK